ncbi:MAG: VOC family protein [Pseudorhodobacter sp.]|nr:VOC family protein [Pseudorhodobacter sp.]
MSFAPYLVFPGTARQAMTDYAAIFGATDLMIMDMASLPPDQRPPGSDGQVMHAQFSVVSGSPLLASDAVTGMENASGSPTVFHDAASIARANEVYAALARGGNAFMPVAPTSWSPAFGMLRDKWGTTWMITVAPGAT